MKSSLYRRYLALGLSLFLIVPCSYAFQGGQGGGGGTGGGSTGGGSTGSGGTGGGSTGGGSRGTTPQPQPQTPQQPSLPKQPQQQPQILFITGTVVMDDGSPLPVGVIVERNCGTRTYREANVASSGHFGFQVGGSNRMSGVMPDASDDYVTGREIFGDEERSRFGSSMDPRSPTNLMGCELRAQAPGYRSTRITLTSANNMGHYDVGTIVLISITKVRGTMVSAMDLGAPKAAKKAYEGAQKAFKKKNFQEAEKNLKTAIEIYPKYAAAWFGLGQIYQQTRSASEARSAFESAVAIDSNYVGPYIHLARLAVQEQKWREVADLTDRALALNPLDFPEGHFFNSVAYLNLNNFEVAERSARKAERLDTQHQIPQVHLILASIFEKKQDVAGARDQLQSYLKFARPSPYADEVRSRLSRLEESVKAQANKQPEPK